MTANTYVFLALIAGPSTFLLTLLAILPPWKRKDLPAIGRRGRD